MNQIWRPLLVAIVVLVLIACAYKALEAQFYYDRSPRGAGLGSIAYMRTQGWGFGPGGNETGIVVFHLSARSVQALRRDPHGFLLTLSPQNSPPSSGYDCSLYEQWRETPLNSEATQNEPMTWQQFSDRYGFGITISDVYRRMLDRSFAAPGSYYSVGRCGTFVFMPNERTAAYMFAG